MFTFYVIFFGIILNIVAPVLPKSPFIKYQDLTEKSKTVRMVLTFIPYALIISYLVLTQTDQTRGIKIEEKDS